MKVSTHFPKPTATLTENACAMVSSSPYTDNKPNILRSIDSGQATSIRQSQTLHYNNFRMHTRDPIASPYVSDKRDMLIYCVSCQKPNEALHASRTSRLAKLLGKLAVRLRRPLPTTVSLILREPGPSANGSKASPAFFKSKGQVPRGARPNLTYFFLVEHHGVLQPCHLSIRLVSISAATGEQVVLAQVLDRSFNPLNYANFNNPLYFATTALVPFAWLNT